MDFLWWPIRGMISSHNANLANVQQASSITIIVAIKATNLILRHTGKMAALQI
jgi:hypothetical protein